MTDPSTAPTPPQKPAKRKRVFDIPKFLFVVLGVAGVSAAGVAVGSPQSLGANGIVLLILMAAALIGMLTWLMGGEGRAQGLFPAAEPGASALSGRRGPEHDFVDALSEAALVAGADGSVICANPAYVQFCQSMGVQTDKGALPGPERVFAPITGLAPAMFRLAKAARAGQSLNEEFPAFLGANGKMRSFAVSVGNIGRRQILWRIIEDRIGGATAPLDGRGLYIDEAPIGFLVAHGDGTVVYMNKTLRRVLGYENVVLPRLDLLFSEPYRLALKRDRTRPTASVSASLSFRARNGVEMPAQVTANWAEGDDGTLRIMAHMVNGLTARAMTAPAESGVVMPRTALDPFFETAPFGAVRLAGARFDQAIIVDANDAFRQMTRGAAVPGETLAAVLAAKPGSPLSAQETLQEALSAPQRLVARSEPDKSLTMQAIDLRNGEFGAFLFRVDEQEAMELQLQQQSKLHTLGYVSAKIAHELNTALNVIKLGLDELLMRHPRGDALFKDLHMIRQAQLIAESMVSKLLAYTRQQTFQLKVLDPGNLVTTITEFIRPVIDNRIKIDVIHGRDLPFIKADQTQMQSVVMNLATNARDAMTQGDRAAGTITIRTLRTHAEDQHKLGRKEVRDGDYLVIEVSDTGTGIPPEIQEKIFLPFVTTKAAGKGTGLGLAMVFGIIKQSHGYVYLRSKMGEGTTFEILLPAYEPTPEERQDLLQANAPPPPPKDVAGRGRILLVEDDNLLRSVTAQVLMAAGYEVLQASHGEEALDLLRENVGKIDLLFTDVMMPIMDGPTLFKEAEPFLGNTRVLFMSGYAEHDFEKSLGGPRRVGYIAKPFGRKDLAECVKRELAEPIMQSA